MLALHASAESLVAVLEVAEQGTADAGFLHWDSYCDLCISRYMLLFQHFYGTNTQYADIGIPKLSDALYFVKIRKLKVVILLKMLKMTFT